MSPNLSEALHKTKLRDILQNDWPVLFKNVEIMKDRDRLNYCSRLKETNDNVRSKHKMLSGLDPGSEKNIFFTVKDINVAIGNI